MEKILLNTIWITVLAGLLVMVLTHHIHFIKEKRAIITSIIVGFLFSLFMRLGYNLIETGFTQINSLLTWLTIIVFTPVWGLIINLLFGLINNIKLSEKNYNSVNDTKFLLITWGIIFICWIPILLATLPGIFAYDSVYQLSWYRSGNISLWHPYAHTMLMGFLVETVGYGLLGSRELGMLIYAVLQMIILSFAFARSILMLKHRSCPKWVIIIIAALFALIPTNGIMAISCTKDIIFSAMSLLSVCYAMELINSDTKKGIVKYSICYFIATLIMMMFRNQGKYVLIAVTIVGIIVGKGLRKNIIIISIASLLLFTIYSKAILLIPGVSEGPVLQESISVPVNQLARAYICDGENFTIEEHEFIQTVIPTYYDYQPGISDAVKNYSNTEWIKEHPSEFIKNYISIGLKCWDDYIDAWARLCIGFWFPDMDYRDPEAYHPYWEYHNSEKNEEWITMDRFYVDGFEWLKNLLDDLTYNNSYQSIPIVNMLFSSGFICWTMLFSIAWVIYKKRYTLLFPFSIPFWIWCTQLLGPVVLYRYVYPIAVCAPIMLGIIITEKK